MGRIELEFARQLRDALGLTRAVETGTYRGLTARTLATVFPRVVTIEVSEELARAAKRTLAGIPAIEVVHGHSVPRLGELHDPSQATFYFLDAHWSFGVVGGQDDECPVLEELRTMSGGHPHDCIVVDDARMFTSSPQPPHEPHQWPEIAEVLDALRELFPGHIATVLNDQVVAVPRSVRDVLNAYGWRVWPRLSLRERLAMALARVRTPLGR